MATDLETGSFEVHREATESVVGVIGEIDVANAPRLLHEVRKSLMAGAEHVRVDLTQTSFMDSAGVHALLDVQHVSDDYVAELEIVCPEGPALRVIELTGSREALAGLRLAA